MDIKEQVIRELRNPKIYTEGILKYVEENIEDGDSRYGLGAEGIIGAADVAP